jgi:hypothetical protein
MALVPAALFGWALLASALVIFSVWPVASLLSLAVLAAGFEAVHALHVGVERIGRYLQVYYEITGSDGPQWESTAMQLGPALPGGAIDPLFTVLFATAGLANLLTVFIPSTAPATAAFPVLVHALFILRLLRARRAAARQRGIDLDTYQRLRDHASAGGPTD